MKILSCAIVLMASLAFVMLGCSDTATPLVSPNDAGASSVTSQPSLAKGAVVHSVTGNGNIWIEGKMGVFTVNARLYADQSVNGMFNLVNTAFNPKSHYNGRIVAVTFYENYSFSNGLSGPTALVWCQVNQGGYWASFFVDNGRLDGGPVQDWVGPTSDIYPNVIELTPQQVADQYPFFFVPTDIGNVVIH